VCGESGIEQFEFLSICANESVFGTPFSSSRDLGVHDPTSPVANDTRNDGVAKFAVIESHTKFVNGIRYHPYSSNFGYLNYFTDPIIEGASPFDFCAYDRIEAEIRSWVLHRYSEDETAGCRPCRDSLPQSLIQRLTEIEELCNDELVVEPMVKLETLRHELSNPIQGSQWYTTPESQRFQYLDYLVLDETMQRLRWKYPRVRNVVDLVEKIPKTPRCPSMTSDQDDGWIFEEHGQVDVWTKQEIDGSLSVRCRSVQNQALFNAISLIYEIDLHTQFMPHLAKSIKLENILGCGQRANFLLRYIYKLPIPFANRDIVLFAFGCNATGLDGVNGIIISAESIPNGQSTWWGTSVPPQGADKTVRENVRGMNFIMKPLPDDKTELTVIANLDKQLALVPKSIVNWMIKDMIKGLYKNMIKLNMKFPHTEFAKRVEANPQFYDWVKANILTHNLDQTAF
jgi:hypothetical protein